MMNMPKQHSFKTYFKLIGVCALLVQTSFAFAQDLDLKECGLDIPKKALKAYEKAEESFAKGNFTEAKNYYLEAYRKYNDFADAIYKLGNYSFNANEFTAAKKYYEKVESICPDFDSDIHYKLGRIAFAEENLDETIKRHQAYLATPDSKVEGVKSKKAKAELAKMMPLYELYNNPVPFDPKPVPSVCTEADEYLGVLSPDGKNFLYTKRYQRKSKNELTTRTIEEFTASVKEDGTYSPGVPMKYPFNRSLNAGGPSITADNKELYLTVCNENEKGKRNCDIFYTFVQDGFWVDLAPLPEPINLKDEWESQASVSADGSKLYFVSSREGGYGGLDLYVCKRKKDNSWGEPENLGPTINTKRDEKSPFIHCDSRTLYFASQGHYGMGGYDVFFSQETDTGWTAPRNIGYPINTEKDDLGLFVSLEGKTAYFASNKLKKGPGGWDIYSFELPEKARPDEMSLVRGKIDIEEDQGLYDANIEVRNLKTNELEKVKVDSSTGEYLVILNKRKGTDYLLTVNKEGHAFSGSHLDLTLTDEDGFMEESPELAKIDVGRSYELRNINFESNSAELNAGARAVIDGFYSFLKENPKMKVTIEGHTDNVGSPAANLTLSQKRADAVVDYLISKGINASRMDSKGFGETRPVMANMSEKGRAANRRTVFVINAK